MARRGDRRNRAAFVGLAAAAIVVYANSLPAAFVFDDRATIVSNAALGDFSNVSALFLGVRGGPTGGRPLTSLSFHLNSLVAGRSPAGYRAVNIIIHAAAAMVLYALLHRMLTRASTASFLTKSPGPVAFAVSLLWVVHPLATESVTYISQRAESLMGLCFLLCVYCAVRGFSEENSAPWFRWSAMACVFAVLAKEVGVVAPLVILLFDGLLESGNIGRAFSRHRSLYTGLLFSWVAAGLLQVSSPRGYSVSFADPVIGPLGYLSRQPSAVLTYVKLAVWPAPLVFDYGYPPPVPGLSRLVGAAAVLGFVFCASVVALRRWPLLGLAGVSFFLILAPTSSVIPIWTEVVAEHRMYLPLACVLVVVVGTIVAFAHWLVVRRVLATSLVAPVGWILLVAAVVGLGFLTWQRNEAYRSELALWRDSVMKVPDNPRALNNLGMALVEAGNASEALTCFHKALSILPNYFEANGGMAVALERLGQISRALPYMQRARELNPESRSAWEGVARLYFRLERWEQALTEAKAYVERFPNDPSANSLYGSLLIRLGRSVEALPYLERARQLAARIKLPAGAPNPTTEAR